ncbi:MAG: DUF2064 domain-containing protein [Motiliproteus sp.]
MTTLKIEPNGPAEAQIQATLVLLFKRPLIGQGKQRLAATLGVDAACHLAEGFLNCALEDLNHWPGPVVLAPASESDRGWAQQLPVDADVVPQVDGNLGQRILCLDQHLMDLGHPQRIYIGSDAPMLTPQHYYQVGRQLLETDVVLSAADDGGVTIMATGSAWPEALIGLPWSTDQLGQALALSCQQSGQQVSYVESGYDIDIESDLVRLSTDLMTDSRPARQQLLQRLETLLKTSASGESVSPIKQVEPAAEF